MNDNIGFRVAEALLKYLGFLIAITMYQAGIAIMAQRRGDKSYATQQRATLNPLPHMDPMGTILCPIITIMLHSPIVLGWPKPHFIETRYFKKPKKDVNLVYLSGVGINFAIAIFCMITLRLLGGGTFLLESSLDLSDVNILIKIMLGLIGITNMTIGALFLLPLPGTAGWNILLNNVSYNTSVKLQQKMMIISIAGLLLIVLGALNFYFHIFIGLFVLGSNTMIGF
ncbi:MAG: site-2 protease family protein [Bdellovibrionota bacterium]